MIKKYFNAVKDIVRGAFAEWAKELCARSENYTHLCAMLGEKQGKEIYNYLRSNDVDCETNRVSSVVLIASYGFDYRTIRMLVLEDRYEHFAGVIRNSGYKGAKSLKEVPHD